MDRRPRCGCRTELWDMTPFSNPLEHDKRPPHEKFPHERRNAAVLVAVVAFGALTLGFVSGRWWESFPDVQWYAYSALFTAAFAWIVWTTIVQRPHR